MIGIKRSLLVLSCFLSVTALLGCDAKSYPVVSLKESLAEICRTEYGIENIQVKINGDTIGIYLPLEKLFAADFKGSVVSGKVRNLENLFEPSKEALDKIEDVLFSIARVLLSTDKDFKFYVLQATDTENTGLQLILKGYVDDVKRVRIWDISRDEYGKRVIHEMKQNRAVLWHKHVRDYFKDLQIKSIQQVKDQYFGPTVTDSALEEVFFQKLAMIAKEKGGSLSWSIEEMRSAKVQRGEVLVYVKAKPLTDDRALLPNEGVAEYLFLITYKGQQPQILRVIPFQYLDANNELKKIPFPKDIQIEQSLENWEEEFSVEDIKVGDFLADQLTRRIMRLISEDERIRNTFSSIKTTVQFVQEAESSHFVFNFEQLVLKATGESIQDEMPLHEDVIYLLNLISRDFVNVLQSYHFSDYHFLALNFDGIMDSRMVKKDDLELFRKKKLDFRGILSSPMPLQ
jgi:hypothetical protein